MSDLKKLLEDVARSYERHAERFALDTMEGFDTHRPCETAARMKLAEHVWAELNDEECIRCALEICHGQDENGNSVPVPWAARCVVRRK